MFDVEARLRAGAPVPPAAPPDLAATADALIDVALTVHDTPVGRLALAATPRGLLACTFVDPDTLAERLARAVSPRVLRAPHRLDAARRALDDYLAGRARALDQPLDLALTGPFQRAVLLTLAETTAYGTTTTYAMLAAAIDRPRASRAVGTALATNPLCIVLPCHRVVRTGGGLGGYAGGLAAKQALLALEHASAPVPS